MVDPGFILREPAGCVFVPPPVFLVLSTGRKSSCQRCWTNVSVSFLLQQSQKRKLEPLNDAWWSLREKVKDEACLCGGSAEQKQTREEAKAVPSRVS